MKRFSKLLVCLLVLASVITSFVACDKGGNGTETTTGGNDTTDQDNAAPETDENGDIIGGEDETEGEGEDALPEFVDYASSHKFDPNSGRAYVEATVHLYVDGDTTHFNVPAGTVHTGVLKARYLGINTPESTGQIEPWGKKASEHTRKTLESATSIIVESDTATWNPDSTGERFLVWVWYKTAENPEYRCLNLEILQAGLAVASKSSDTAYAEICTQILHQAVTHKLYVHDRNLKDPDFYYGAALPLTLKELKTNIESYKGKSVSFEGVVINNTGTTAYVEEYDEESGLYYGMQIFYGYNLGFQGEQILSVGNRVRIVGNVQYYEAGGTYQISDIKYHAMRPDDEVNIQKISDGHSAAYQRFEAKDLLTGKKDVQVITFDQEGEEVVETKSFDIGFLAMHGSASLTNLTIKSIYTTQNEDSSNFGALSITCEAEDGTTIVVRTAVLKDENGKTITADAFPIGSKIEAKGIVDVYNDVYQLKVFSKSDIGFLWTP